MKTQLTDLTPNDVCARLGIAHPVLQAALGGGFAGPELAAAVSRAGGLGHLGLVTDAADFARALERTRALAEGAPFAANLLLPVTRPAHVRAVIEARVPVVSLFFGSAPAIVRALHEAGAFVLHQVGTAAEAERALRDGADALIVQGLEAGGHLRAQEPLATLLPEVRALAPDRPLFAAGGIHDRASVARVAALGADGVAAGTRFLLTPECHAHEAYKARLLAADRTLVTLLFSLGWHARHRVVPNAATERWCARDPLGPRAVRMLTRLSGPLAHILPPAGAERIVQSQRANRPLFTPLPLVPGMDARMVDATPLYAGECVARIDRLVPAAEVVAELAAGFHS